MNNLFVIVIERYRKRHKHWARRLYPAVLNRRGRAIPTLQTPWVAEHLTAPVGAYAYDNETAEIRQFKQPERKRA